MRRLEHRENGLGRAIGGCAGGDADAIDRIDAGGFEDDVGGNLQRCVHVGSTWGEHFAFLGKRLTVGATRLIHETDLAGGIGVVHAGFGAGGNHQLAEIEKRSHSVADNLSAREQFDQGAVLVRNFHNLVIRGFDSRHQGHGRFQTFAVATGRNERQLVVAQRLADQSAGVAAGAVNDDGFLAHGLLP